MISRLFWATLLAGCLGYAFSLSWRREHGLNDGAGGGETQVWISPLMLPAIAVVICGIYMFEYGAAEGLEMFTSLAWQAVVTGSLYFACMLALLPVLRRFFSARACATSPRPPASFSRVYFPGFCV